MRLVYLIPEFPGQTHILFWREVDHLRARGHEVEIVSTRRPRTQCPHPFADEPCTYLWPYGPSDLAAQPGLATLLKQLHLCLSLEEGGVRERLAALTLIPASWRLAKLIMDRRIDFVHGHSFANVGYILRLAYEVRPFSYGMVLHGGIENYGYNHTFKLQRATLAAGVNASTTAEVTQLSPPGRVDTIPCGVPLDVFAYCARDFTKRLRLITVARLVEGKGIQYVIEALAMVRDSCDFEYILVGAGEYRSELERLAADAGIAERIIFTGALPQSEVAEIMRTAHLAVQMSYGTFETTAIFVREAMATGLPAIMSNVGDSRSMISEGREGFVIPQHDARALADRIALCFADRALLERMSRAAHDKATADFSSAVGPERLIAHMAEL